MKLWHGRYRYLGLFHISEAFWRALVLSVATGVEYHAEILMNMVNAIIGTFKRGTIMQSLTPSSDNSNRKQSTIYESALLGSFVPCILKKEQCQLFKECHSHQY